MIEMIRLFIEKAGIMSLVSFHASSSNDLCPFDSPDPYDTNRIIDSPHATNRKSKTAMTVPSQAL